MFNIRSCLHPYVQGPRCRTPAGTVSSNNLAGGRQIGNFCLDSLIACPVGPPSASRARSGPRAPCWNNDGGRDTDVYKVGLLSPGSDLRLTLRRTAGRFALTVENLTEGGASTLTIRHPDFLDGEPDLYVGLFGANPYSDINKTLFVRELEVTVWATAPGGP